MSMVATQWQQRSYHHHCNCTPCYLCSLHRFQPHNILFLHPNPSLPLTIPFWIWQILQSLLGFVRQVQTCTDMSTSFLGSWCCQRQNHHSPSLPTGSCAPSYWTQDPAAETSRCTQSVPLLYPVSSCWYLSWNSNCKPAIKASGMAWCEQIKMFGDCLLLSCDLHIFLGLHNPKWLAHRPFHSLAPWYSTWQGYKYRSWT